MIKSDLVERVMQATDLPNGFGVFQVKDRKRGIGRNPKTGREVEIPPGKTIRFKPGKALRNMS